MIKILIVIYFLLSCSYIMSQDRWVYLTSNQEDSIDYYYDSQSVIYTDSSIIIWAKFLYYGERIYTDPRTKRFNKLYYNTPIGELSKFDEEYIATIKVQLDKFRDYDLYEYELTCSERIYKKLDNLEYFMDGTSYHSRSAEYGSAIKHKILPETLYEIYLNNICK